MPIIRVELLPGRSDEQLAEFVSEVTASAIDILKCAQETVDVVFFEVEPKHWAHAGKLYSARSSGK